MLKFTNSFCRYLKFTCANIVNYSNRTHVKPISYLSDIQQTCKSVKYDLNLYLFTSFIKIGGHTKFYSSKNKKLCKKNKIYSNVSNKLKQMSESLQPTLNHVSYGGQFEVSSDNSSSDNDWNKTQSNLPDNSVNDRRKTLSKNPSNSTDKNEACCLPSDFRVWEEVLNKSDVKDGNAFKFKILSYNVLAQYLLECHPYLYTDCHPHNLKWNVRAARLYDEITNLSPDILCLQEVQASHIDSFYSKLKNIGYFGIFKQKTGQRQDGCAIYFKQSSFDMQDHNTVEYYQPELPILNRDNIGIMVKLLPKNYLGPPIVIATTHLLYNPRRTDVRLAQVQLLLAEIDRFAYYNNGQESGHVPVILTGDLNSTPDSAVVKLLDKGHVSVTPFRDSSDWKKIGVTDNCQHLSVYLNRKHGINTDFCMTKIYNSDYRETLPEPDLDDPIPIAHDFSDLFNSGVLTHSLNLQSTYTKYKPDGCVEVTTFQEYWVTVDYIYFRSLMSLPSPVLTDINSRRLSRYQALEQMRQHFWRRWHSEYVTELQHHCKWKTRCKALKLGDLVIIKDDNMPPLLWRLGRVQKLYPGEDGVPRVADIKTSRGVRRALNQ